MMYDLRVLLLGPPEVTLDCRTLTPPPPLLNAIQCFLATCAGTATRHSLRQLFFDHLPESQGYRLLDQSLEELCSHYGIAELLQERGGLISFGPGPLYVDHSEFQEYLEAAGRFWQPPHETPLPEPVEAALRSAAALWRSPRFLEGLELPEAPVFGRWRTQTGRQLERTYTHVLQRLADHAFASGDFYETLQFARQALLTDPLNEENHYRILQALIELNHLSEAREHFHHLRDLLRRELNTAPGPRLVALYRKIRETGELPEQPAPAVHWDLRPTMRVPFTGRQEELLNLGQAYERGGSVFILGEAGQGKTRLLQEFVAHLPLPPRLLLTGCRPAENGLTYQPIIELLRHNLRPEEWIKLPTAWASQLSLLLPELQTMRPELDRPLIEFAPEAPPGQARALLLESIRQVFVMMAAKNRLVFCLDDAHWADDATLNTIAYLLERPPFNRDALLVVTARTELPESPIYSYLETLAQSHSVHVFHLNPLNENAIRSLVQHIFATHPSTEFVQRLADETGGNPLFILETLRALQEQDSRPDVTQPIPLPLAESVQTAIRNRLNLLRPTARRALEIAAVVGVEFDPQVVALVGNYDNQLLVRVLQELEERALVETVKRQTAYELTYCFAHQQIREVLLQEINAVQVRLWHGEIAQILERQFNQANPQSAAVLAHHFYNAGNPGRAFDYWLQAGRRARQLFSPQDAVQLFECAENLIQNTVYLSDEQLYRLYSEWTDLAYETEDADTIQRINTDLLDHGRERNSPLLIGKALDGLSEAAMVKNQFEEGLSYCEQAIPYLERGGKTYEHMEAYNHRGTFLYMLNRLQESVEAFQDALSLGTETQEPAALRARGNAHYQIAIARTLAGWPEAGENHARLSLADFSQVNRAHSEVTAYSALAFARLFLGEFTQARFDCQQGLELAERIGAGRMLGYLNAYRALIELACGNVDLALDHADQAADLGQQYGHAEIVAGALRARGDLFTWLHDYEAAHDFYQQAWELNPHSFVGVDALSHLGLVTALAGADTEGEDLLSEASEIAQKSGLGIIFVQAQIARARLNITRGQTHQTYQLAVQALKEAQNRKMTPARLDAGLVAGEIALQVEDLANARHYLEGVIESAAALPYPWAELQARAMLARLPDPSGRPDERQHNRVEHLLDDLAKKTRRAEVLAAFEAFRTSLLESR